MGRHALLSASSSKRWLNCPPSARLEEQFTGDIGSVYAEEGTAAHALAEHKLKRQLKRRSKRPVSDYDCDEMEECTDEFELEDRFRREDEKNGRKMPDCLDFTPVQSD